MLPAVDHPRQKVPNERYRRVLKLIADGHTICGALKLLRDKGMRVASASYFIRWCMKTPERWSKYLRAQQVAAELEADRINRIADKAGKGELDPTQANIALQRARLRIETRKWTMAKRSPHRWGDKMQHEHSGNLTVVVDTGIAAPLPRLGVSIGDPLDYVADAAVRCIDDAASQVERSAIGSPVEVDRSAIGSMPECVPEPDPLD